MARNYRVMTYNVKYDTGDGPESWDRRRDAVAHVVSLHRPALVGLQEVLSNQLADLRERLPEYEWVGEGRLGGDEGERSPIGFRSDRFRLRDDATFWLSPTPDEPGSVGWDAKVPRVATRVALEDRETGEQIVHYNTHFDHVGERARRESAALLAERVAADGGVPTVVTGDLNCTPADDPCRILAADATGLTAAADAPPERRLGPETTFTDYEAPVPDAQIDHVYASDDFEVCRYAVVTQRGGGRYPSDHLPVVVDLRTPRPAV